MDPSLTVLLEECAANAWPARVNRGLDGWRLRADACSARRNNSVLPLTAGGSLALPAKLAEVEAFYARLGRPARFQMTDAGEPAGLDEVLARRGYRVTDYTCVMTAPCDPGEANDSRVILSPRPTAAWFAVFCAAEPYSRAEARRRRAVMRAIGVPTAYAYATRAGEAAGVGVGAAERGWLGVFCMATRPEYRRRGVATDVLGALTAWGREHGARNVYLQVSEANEGAIATYRSAGFTTLYKYHYRELSL